MNNFSKTANSFRVNSEFSFKEKSELLLNNKFNNTVKENFRLKIKINKSQKGIQNVVDKYSTLKAINLNLNTLTKVELEHESKKEEEIEKLNESIQDCLSTNDELKYLISLEYRNRSELEIEQRSIADYCNDLKKKFDNIEQTVRNYEETIKRIKNENDQIQETYDTKIDEMERENKRLKERLDNKIGIEKQQKTKIIELQVKQENEIKETEEQRLKFKEKQTLNQIKFDELENKFMNLQKKIYEFELNENIRKAEMRETTKKAKFSKKEQKSEVEINIDEYQRENENLVNSIREVNFRLSELQLQMPTEDINKYSKGKYKSNFKK